MSSNITCVHGNVNTTCVDPSSSAGLTVGLTLLCLLLVVVAGALVCKFHNRARYMLQFGQRRVQMKADNAKAPQAESHQYTSKEQSVSQSPIYENLTVPKSGYKRAVANPSRLPSDPEEDLYLQCDSPHDVIYSNDPACNLVIHPDPRDEDMYIVPCS